jgi:hypothetical protein
LVAPPLAASAGIATAAAITAASTMTIALRLIVPILRILFAACR